MSSPESNSPQWIERLFARLQVRYGSNWSAMWEGIDPDAVKADWEENLAGVFTRNRNAIVFALANLPERPPTSDQFVKLCMQAPWPRDSALPAPLPGPPDPERLAAALQAMEQTKGKVRSASPAQQCIEDIERVAKRNGKLGRYQREMVKSCLRMPGTHSTLPGMAEILGDVHG